MVPQAVTQDNLKWSIRLCLTVHPAAPNLLPVGQPGLLRVKEKMLMFFLLTRYGFKLEVNVNIFWSQTYYEKFRWS